MSRMVVILLGILVSIVLLVLVVSAAANIMFTQSVKKEVRELFDSAAASDGNIIQESDLGVLPSCVQKWLKYSQVIGKGRIQSVRLKQEAIMRLKEEQAWMPTEAEQYFTTADPGFIWEAKIKAAPLVHIVGRDKYYEGKGNMLIKLLSLITIANSSGDEIDQGTLLRYLAETVWFPTAALESYIEWEEIDSNSAKATMSYGGVTASGTFTFSEKGEVTGFTAERYMESDGQYSLETWSIDMDDYREFDGIAIPSKAEVTWKLKGGDFTWFKLEITEVEYNRPVVY